MMSHRDARPYFFSLNVVGKGNDLAVVETGSMYIFKSRYYKVHKTKRE